MFSPADGGRRMVTKGARRWNCRPAQGSGGNQRRRIEPRKRPNASRRHPASALLFFGCCWARATPGNETEGVSPALDAQQARILKTPLKNPALLWKHDGRRHGWAGGAKFASLIPQPNLYMTSINRYLSKCTYPTRKLSLKQTSYNSN